VPAVIRIEFHMSVTYTLRILHVSDVHFRSAEGILPAERIQQVRREEWRRESVLGAAWSNNLDELAASGRPFDLVCLTGDVADWGLPQEYARATPFVLAVLSRLKLDPDRLFLVPGNHDVNRKVGEKSWRRLRDAVARVAPGQLSDWMAGGGAPLGLNDTLREAVLERSAAYWAWVERDLLRAALLPSRSPHGRLGYRCAIQLPGRPFQVHVVGLDSAWLAGDNNDAGKLRVTENQVGQLTTDGGQPLEGLRLALVHHPLTDLADGSDVRRLLADHVDILLRGHQHTAVSEKWSDPDRHLLELAAGCLYEGEEGHRYPNAFHVIDVTTDEAGRPLKYDIWFRGWSSRGHWFDDASLYREAQHGRLSLSVDHGTLTSSSASTPAGSPATNASGYDAARVQVGTGLKAGGDVRAAGIDVDATGVQLVEVVKDVTATGSIDLRDVHIGRGGNSDGRS
jgi:3',5'-cyclic AMP phosphodiesterase CpdA